jgi:GPH family glycoside/pentoside/hexuronide:cation symporter
MEEEAAAEGGDAMQSVSDRLPVSLKLAYGFPSFPGGAMGLTVVVFMPAFYSDVILAPLGYIAVAIALTRSLDALTDPMMGWLSDRTKTRWGRRKPYIALGMPLMALAFYMLFVPPESLATIQAPVWYGIFAGLGLLFLTIMGIPQAALGAELSPDYNERSSLFGYGTLFGAAGAIFGAVLPTILEGRGMDERAVFAFIAGFYAILFVILQTWFLIRVPERPEFAQRESNPFVPGVRRALRNRPFLILLFSGIVGAIPAAIPALLMPYYVGYVLQPEDSLRWVGTFLVLYLGTGMLFVPVWIAVARRIGKLRTLIVGSVIGIIGSVFYFFAGPGDLFFAGCIYFITGTVSTAGAVVNPAMAADVIDYDELRTGKRREAQYTAFRALIPKFVSIPGSSVPLAVLAAVGYVPNEAQSDQVLFWIRFMYSLFPASFYLISLAIVSRYPLSEAVHVKIRQGIAALAGGESAVDPLTGNSIAPHGGDRVSEEDGWFLDYFTPGELRRMMGGHGSRLMTSVITAGGISLLVFLGAIAVALFGTIDPESRAPVTTVVAIVTAGLALTAFIFHCLRLKPARRMAGDPIPDEIIQAHLEGVIENPRRPDY